MKPQIFPHIIEFLIIQEGTELLLVTYPLVYILIPGFWRGGVLYLGVGNGAPRQTVNPQIVTHVIEQFIGQEGAYPLLPILASGFGGLVMGHLCRCESLDPYVLEFLIVQEGAEPFPVMFPPLPVLVHGCGKLGRLPCIWAVGIGAPRQS